MAASKKLSGIAAEHEVIVIDRHDYTTMIPALPDLAGDKIPGNILTADVRTKMPEGIRFVHDEVVSVDLDKKTVTTKTKKIDYNFLVIASGSVTNFFGFNQNLDNIYTLTSFPEAERIKKDFSEYLSGNDNPHVVLSGGGYTALELAGSLNYMASRKNREVKITLVEKSVAILQILSYPQLKRIHDYIDRHKFKLITEDVIEKFDGSNVRLDSGKEYEDVFLCWTTGTKFAIPEIKGKLDRLPDGRIKVGETLQAPGYPGVFAAGDSAAIKKDGHYIRKAVNFSIYSGAAAGDNIKRSIRAGTLKKFHPVDLGWVIPLHNDSVGEIFGKIPVWGKPGLRMHYFMCGFRNYNMKNAAGFYKTALKLF